LRNLRLVPGAGEITNALTDQPRVRFVSTDKIDSFDDVDIKPGRFLAFSRR